VAWSVLQSASNSTSAGTVAATFSTANVQAGTKIIAIVSVGATTAPAVTSVKDAALNTWTQVGNANQANARVYIFALDTPAGDVGTKPTLTATSSSTPGLSIVIQEVSGLLAGNTTAMCDGSAATLTGTASSTGSPSYTSTASNEYLVSAYGDFGSGNTVVISGGWSADTHNVNSSGNSNCMVQFKNSTNGAETDGFTTADAGGWAVAEVAFQLAAAAGGVTYVPPRYGQAAPVSPAPWSQRDRRDANTVATAANPLVSPLDTAWQADARYWHLYGDTAARDRRAYFTQRNYGWDPLLLATAELEGNLLGGGDYGRQFLAATHYDRREVPQQPARLADPVLITTAELEGALLGGADTARHYTWYADRREVPQQRPYVSDPLLLTTAELENELLGGAETWLHYVTAAYYDRREVPQQRPYISDPSFYPSSAPTDPLTVAWGAGGPYWHLYNRAADIADRREYLYQRLYQSDPLLLATALLENELLGGAETGKYYRTPATHADRREVPQQRPYISDPSFYPAGAVTDPLTVAWGAGGNYWHLYNRAADATDRREGPQQRPYISPPLLLATALLENELLGGAGTAQRYGSAAYYDRREVPQQRGPVALVTPPVPFDPLLAAWADLTRRYLLAATHADRRLYPQQRLYFPVPLPPPPFTVGYLTAGDVALAVLSAAAGTTGTSALTASDTRTGGPA
jgi:hypothetical protein